jgi:hypothetical protein
MNTVRHSLARCFVLASAAAMLAACGDRQPIAPEPQPEIATQLETITADYPALRGHAEKLRSIAALLLSTARYHNLEVAKSEGFVFLHGCENRPEEGPVGTVYVHMGRLTDGQIDPLRPEALIYEPQKNGRMRLVGVELAMPYALWTEPEPPQFLGQPFQKEDEFGVWGLHVWLWSYNPEGLFAESNPRVSCEAD